jgi:hypothetical protein
MATSAELKITTVHFYSLHKVMRTSQKIAKLMLKEFGI